LIDCFVDVFFTYAEHVTLFLPLSVCPSVCQSAG